MRPLSERGQDGAEDADPGSMSLLDDRPPIPPSNMDFSRIETDPTIESGDHATSSDEEFPPVIGFTLSVGALAKSTRESDRSQDEGAAQIVQDSPDRRESVARAIIEHLEGRGRILDGVAGGCDNMDQSNPIAALGCLLTGGGAINSRSLDISVSAITVHSCDDVSERFGRGHLSCRWSGQISAGMNNPMAQLLTGAASLGIKSHLFREAGRGRYTLLQELR